METKQQQQKTLTIKNQDLDLNAFLHNVICLSDMEINKHYNKFLSDTIDVKFSLYKYLDFNSTSNQFKSRILLSKNGTISNITFKFIAGYNMQLIYDCFYASRKKRRLFIIDITRMCRLLIFSIHNIDRNFIDFDNLYRNFIFIFLFFFSFLLYLFYIFLEFCPFSFVCIFSLRDLGFLMCYNLVYLGGILPRISNKSYLR
jgi:hypothetical protein